MHNLFKALLGGLCRVYTTLFRSENVDWLIYWWSYFSFYNSFSGSPSVFTVVVV